MILMILMMFKILGGVCMKIINILSDDIFLREYISLCYYEWSNREKSLDEYMEYKIDKIKNGDNVILVLGLVDKELIGFISLFKNDCDERLDLSPWYATMFVKEKYRSNGYSRILNDALLKEAKRLNYDRVYLKSNLINYYEKFGAKVIGELNDGERLFYIDLR